MMNGFEVKNVDDVRQQLGQSVLDIHHTIDLAFAIKGLVKKERLDFAALIEIAPTAHWHNLAQMLPYLPKKWVIEYLDQLLEGFMDLNWSGSRLLYGYLAELEIEPLKASFDRVTQHAMKINDLEWVYFLLVFMESEGVGYFDAFGTEISTCRKYLEAHGYELD